MTENNVQPVSSGVPSPAMHIGTFNEGSGLLLERTFNAPRALVFQAFTDCQHLPHWFAPRPWTMPLCELDLRPGGVWRYMMRGPEGDESWGKSVYHEIDAPGRLVYTDSFTDAEGTVNAEMPSFTIELTLTERDGRTHVVSRSQLPSAEQVKMLLDMGMAEGVTISWDSLDEYLQTLSA